MQEARRSALKLEKTRRMQMRSSAEVRCTLGAAARCASVAGDRKRTVRSIWSASRCGKCETRNRARHRRGQKFKRSVVYEIRGWGEFVILMTSRPRSPSSLSLHNPKQCPVKGLDSVLILTGKACSLSLRKRSVPFQCTVESSPSVLLFYPYGIISSSL